MKFLKEAIDKQEIEDIINTMFVTLMITENCNFRCDYCDVVDFDKPHRFITMDEFMSVLEFIDYQDPRPNLVFRFFGGEPTIHPDFIEMVQRVHKNFEGRRNLDILLTTNLAKSYNYIETIPSYVKVVPSLHTDFVDNYDNWFSKVLRLNDKGMLHHVLLMLKEDNHDVIKDLYKRYSRILPVIIVPIDEYLVTPEYQEFKKHFPCEVDDSEYEAFFDKENVSKAFMCSSGIFINENGDMFNCWVKSERKINVFDNPRTRIPKFHMCHNYTEDCDKEVIRCSLDYYLKNFVLVRKEEFTKEELELYNRKRVLFRCNG